MDTTPQWDTIIIGGGPAGLSAALMLGRARRRVLVIDAGEPRNRFASHMHGLLGSDGMDPAELLARGRAELDRYGVTIHAGTVTDVTEAGDGLRVATHRATHRATHAATHAATHLARTAVLATGLTDDLPNIPGLAQRWGNTVLHCPYCHGWEVRDRHLGVLVRDPRHLHLAQLVRQWSVRLTVIATNPEHVDAEARERLEARGARILTGPVARIEGDAPGIDAVVMADGTRVEIDALFAPGDPRLHDTPVAGLGLESVDGPWGATLAVDATGRTSHPRLWVAGNVTDLAATVTASLAAGAAAGAAINAALVSLDADSARASAYWEERYAEGDRMWSGRPNATLVEVVRGSPRATPPLRARRSTWAAARARMSHGSHPRAGTRPASTSPPPRSRAARGRCASTASTTPG
jgi:thioredoxin reductase